MDTQTTYNTSAAVEQEGSPNLADHLRTSRAAIAQTKLALARLKRCYASTRPRGVLDQLSAGMDAALSALERLDFGRSSGGLL
jgi:hypothetical protein